MRNLSPNNPNQKLNLSNIIESVIDVTRKTLDPAVFDKHGDKYEMRPGIITFLQNIVDEIDRNIVNVEDSLVKGSILSFQWLENTDVDLLIQVDPSISEEDRRRIQDEVDERYSLDIPGTNHPLQIYINPGEYDLANADGIYKLDGGWVKGPYNIAVNIDSYMGKFNKMVGSIDLATGELKRDIIDYNMLKQLPIDEIEGLSGRIQQKIDEINKDVEDLVFQYKHIRDMRHSAFRNDMTPQQIAEYGTKNALPENVVFKLMERYYYLKFIRDLKSLTEEDKIDSDEEVDEVKKSLEQSQFGQ